MTGCTSACRTGHTRLPGCAHGHFFQPGRTYSNNGIFAGRQQVRRFACVAVEPHPTLLSEITALGWIEAAPGLWIVGGITVNDYQHEQWSEI